MPLATTKSGRHRYYCLADPAVAEAVEALARVAPPPVRSLREATRSELIRYARTCYDHLAGQLGVAIAQGLERKRALTRNGNDYVLGPKAGALFAAFGIDVAELQGGRRPLTRGCLDWSERQLAGALGAALTGRLFELDWIRRRDGNRSVELTKEGRAHLERDLSVDVGSGNRAPRAAARARLVATGSKGSA